MAMSSAHSTRRKDTAWPWTAKGLSTLDKIQSANTILRLAKPWVKRLACRTKWPLAAKPLSERVKRTFQEEAALARWEHILVASAAADKPIPQQSQPSALNIPRPRR